MVAARKVRAVLRVAEAHGVDPAPILRTLGVRAEELDDEERHLGQAVWGDVWRAVAEATGDPAIGIAAGQRIDRGYFGVLDYLVRSSADVGAALDAATRFFPLANTHGRLEVVREGGEVTVERHVLGDESGSLPPQVSEFALTAMVQLFRDATIDDWSLRRVTFRHRAPTNVSRHEAFFACPLRFGASVDAVVIDERVLEIGMQAPDAGLRRLIERHGEQLLQELPTEATIVDDVRRVLVRELGCMRDGSDHVAFLLGTSRRTLHRRLEEAGTSFKRIREDLRRSLAHRYLVDGEMTVGEVAVLLGYSEVSTFHRAFKGWFDETPARYRQRALAEAAGARA